MPRFKIIKKDGTEFDFHSNSAMLDKSAHLSISPKILFDTNIIKANQDDGGLEVGDRFLKLRGISIKATYDQSVVVDNLLNNLIDAIFKIDYFVDIKAARRIKCAPDKNLAIKSKPGAEKRFGEIDVKLLALDALWEAETATTGSSVAITANSEVSFTPTIGGYANTGLIFKFVLAANTAGGTNTAATNVNNASILIRDNKQSKHIQLAIPLFRTTQTLEIDMENGAVYLYATPNASANPPVNTPTQKGAKRNNLLTRNSNFFYCASGVQNIEINANFTATMAYEFRPKFFI